LIHLSLERAQPAGDLHDRYYVRYVDDFILLHPSAQWLGQALASINAYLPRLGLELNPRKTIIQPINRGIDFAGHVIKPWRREVRRRSIRTALRRIEELPQEKVFETGNSYLGLLRHADGHHDRSSIANALRKRGHSVSADLTKAYR